MADYTRGEVIEIVHKLRKADLHRAKYDEHTIFPDGFDPEEAGMVLVRTTC